MAPHFRTNTQTRRGNRSGYVEHDDFEGLPVRQWRQEWVSIAPPPPLENNTKNDIWDVELPHGMPKDATLLPAHTQELLRAARSGRLYKRSAPTEDEEADAEAQVEKPEKKEEDPSTKGYMVKLWKQIPRNAEGPGLSHLAKRRKGTVTLSSNLPAGQSSGPTVTKATVRRIDAAGNPYTQEVTLAEGQKVDGEIISTTVVSAPLVAVNADGSAAPTHMKRRPPPPKRKPKGPGRGRKKKLPLPLPARLDGSAPVPGTEGAQSGVAHGVTGATMTNTEGDNGETKHLDSEMVDGDDDEEGDDGDEDGDEGEEGGDEDYDAENPDTETEAAGSGKGTPLDHEMKDSPLVEPVEENDAAASRTRTESATSSTSDTSLPPRPPSLVPPPAPQYEGSPLKNVLIPSPVDPSPNTSPSLPSLPTTEPGPAPAAEQISQTREAAEDSQPPAVEGSAIETGLGLPVVPSHEDVKMSDTAPLAGQVASTTENELASVVEPLSLPHDQTTEAAGMPNEGLSQQLPLVETTLPDIVPPVGTLHTEVASEAGIPPAGKPDASAVLPQEPLSQSASTSASWPAAAPAPAMDMAGPAAPLHMIPDVLEPNVPVEPSTEAPPVDLAPSGSAPDPAEAAASTLLSATLTGEREPDSPDLLGGLEASLAKEDQSKEVVTEAVREPPARLEELRPAPVPLAGAPDQEKGPGEASVPLPPISDIVPDVATAATAPTASGQVGGPHPLQAPADGGAAEEQGKPSGEGAGPPV